MSRKPIKTLLQVLTVAVRKAESGDIDMTWFLLDKKCAK